MEPPNMNPLLHWGNKGIIRGFHFLDPLGGLGNFFGALEFGVWEFRVMSLGLWSFGLRSLGV